MTSRNHSPKAVILDRDGVLNKKPHLARYVRNWDEFEWIPGAVEAVRLLKSKGCMVCLATNQAGVARGVLSAEDLNHIHARMQADLGKVGASVDKIYVCPHAPEAGCECRKPKPGLLFAIQKDFKLDLTQTPFIGDDPKDMQAGRAAGCPTFLVDQNATLYDIVTQKIL
jgi:histidinol-phosphate phosphatase family protein